MSFLDFRESKKEKKKKDIGKFPFLTSGTQERKKEKGHRKISFLDFRDAREKKRKRT